MVICGLCIAVTAFFMMLPVLPKWTLMQCCIVHRARINHARRRSGSFCYSERELRLFVFLRVFLSMAWGATAVCCLCPLLEFEENRPICLSRRTM